MTEGNAALSPAPGTAAKPALLPAITVRPIPCHGSALGGASKAQALEKPKELTLRQGQPKAVLAAILPKLPISLEALTSSAAIPAPVPTSGLTRDTRQVATPRLHEDGSIGHECGLLPKGRSLEGHTAR